MYNLALLFFSLSDYDEAISLLEIALVSKNEPLLYYEDIKDNLIYSLLRGIYNDTGNTKKSGYYFNLCKKEVHN